MEKDGKIKVCEFTAPVAMVTYKEGEANSFERLWNEGYFDNIKKEYFINKSTNLSNYRVQFGQTGEQMKKGLWRIIIYYKFENVNQFNGIIRTSMHLIKKYSSSEDRKEKELAVKLANKLKNTFISVLAKDSPEKLACQRVSAKLQKCMNNN